MQALICNGRSEESNPTPSESTRGEEDLGEGEYEADRTRLRGNSGVQFSKDLKSARVGGASERQEWCTLSRRVRMRLMVNAEFAEAGEAAACPRCHTKPKKWPPLSLSPTAVQHPGVSLPRSAATGQEETHEVHHDVVVALDEILEVRHRQRHRVLPILVRQLSVRVAATVCWLSDDNEKQNAEREEKKINCLIQYGCTYIRS